jgi:hypothetical protein
MQRKITPIEAGADLPDLTEYQLKFCDGILAGKTSSDAYRAAYDCSNMQPPTIWAAASRLRNDYRVELWIAAARKAEIGKFSRTREQHIARLDRLQQIAIDSGNIGAAVQAEQLIGKVEGHHTDRIEVTSQDPMQTLREIAALSPELAAKLAHDQGIEWQTETAH